MGIKKKNKNAILTTSIFRWKGYGKIDLPRKVFDRIMFSGSDMKITKK